MTSYQTEGLTAHAKRVSLSLKAEGFQVKRAMRSARFQEPHIRVESEWRCPETSELRILHVYVYLNGWETYTVLRGLRKGKKDVFPTERPGVSLAFASRDAALACARAKVWPLPGATS